MTEKFYVTTPIYYVNARPHLGHAYTTIIADVVTRYHSMKSEDTFFLTGTDEHGDKVVEAAKKENISPRTYVDRISGLFRSLWPELNIDFNRFIRTTEKDHMYVVEKILQKIYDAGDIYFSEYEGLYCFGCERFYTERELVDGKCPDHESAPKIIKESNYFFKMSRYQDWLIDHIRKNSNFIRPERYKNEVLAFLREPLEDLCISRPKTRLKWGITLPFDEKYVTYVWFDALLNYISALGYPDGELFKKFWPVAQHIVAKDILKPHGIYWPIMLKAAGIDIYQHLNVHGYWNIEQSKMSKSLGNVIEPLELKNVYGLDAFRFFLTRDMTFGLDSNFSESALIHRINSDLANDLGNLFSRTLTMAHKYLDGVVPEIDTHIETELGLELNAHAKQTIIKYASAMDEFAFHRALQSVWDFIARMNKCIDVMAPWELAKKETNRPQLNAVMVHLLEGLRVVSGLIYPIMPTTAKKMHKHLGLNEEEPFYTLKSLHRWPGISPGTNLMKTVILFPRIDPKKLKAATVHSTYESRGKPEVKPPISIEDFSKVDLRVATVIKAETVPRAKKLIKLDIDVGERRTIVAGIAGSYTPEELVGKQIVVVANLKPAKIMGILSNGMLLAAVGETGTSIVTPSRKMAPGTRLQ